MTKPGARPTFFVNLTAYMITAFWHGFYPVYYITFTLGMLAVEVGKDLYKARKLLFYRLLPSPLVRHICGNVLTFLCFNYIGMIFKLLTLESVIKFMQATYFFVPIAMIAILSVTRSTNLIKYAQKWEHD